MISSKTTHHLSVLLAIGGAFYLGVLWQEQQSAFQDLYHSQGQATDDDAAAWSLKNIHTPPRPHFLQTANEQGKDFSARYLTDTSHHPVGYRPPISSVLDTQNNTLIGDAQSLIQFAVIGFGKCGTTTVISWLDQHPQLETYPTEIYDLMFGRVGALVKLMYEMPDGPFRRGYKSPADLAFMASVDALRVHFPRTKLIFGIRHPLLWFQSLYNFRVQNLNANENHTAFPKPNDLIGLCVKGRKNSCTHKGEFGLHIRNLGKTMATHNSFNQQTGRYELTPLERLLYKSSHETRPYTNVQQVVPNPVFMFEINQLSDTNTSRTNQFRKDMTDFMELETPLPEMPYKKPGRSWKHNQELQSRKDSLKIDICDLEHLPVRKEMMRIARGASIWLREYFLDERVLENAGVHVSSPDFLKKLLEKWMEDPCGDHEADDAGSEFLQILEKDRRYRKLLPNTERLQVS